jgi:hypothetical protein
VRISSLFSLLFGNVAAMPQTGKHFGIVVHPISGFEFVLQRSFGELA